MGMAGDHLAVRTALFDPLLSRAFKGTCRQVVLLGAGLDTLTYRLDWPPGAAIFEIDHEDVLAFEDAVMVTQSALLSRRRMPVHGDPGGNEWGAGLQRRFPRLFLQGSRLFSWQTPQAVARNPSLAELVREG